MSVLAIVIIEIVLCFGISLALIALIQPRLRDLLIEICGTQMRAQFWVVYTKLLLIIAPLLLVIYFIPTDTSSSPNIAVMLKDTLFRSLLGDFIALVLIGQVIWKSIRNADADIKGRRRSIEEV